jgi:hypothetical protein
MVSLSELGEHRNDPSQHCLTRCVLSSSQYFAGFETVLNRCAFQRRAASDPEEAGPIDALQAPGHLVCPSHVPDRNPVDVALLMPEVHFCSDYDNDNDNDNVCIP